MIRCWRVTRRSLGAARGEAERHFEHSVDLDRASVTHRRLELPLGKRFGGAAIEPWVQAADECDLLHAAIAADHAKQADDALDPLLGSGGDVFRIYFMHRRGRLDRAGRTARIVIREPDHPTPVVAGY